MFCFNHASAFYANNKSWKMLRNNQFKAQSLNRKSYRKFTLSYLSVTCFKHVGLLWTVSALDRKQVRGCATFIVTSCGIRYPWKYSNLAKSSMHLPHYPNASFILSYAVDWDNIWEFYEIIFVGKCTSCSTAWLSHKPWKKRLFKVQAVPNSNNVSKSGWHDSRLVSFEKTSIIAKQNHIFFQMQLVMLCGHQLPLTKSVT